MATADERNRGLGAYSTPGVDNQPGAPSTDFRLIGAAPLVTWKTALLEPPTVVYVGREDHIQIRITANLAGLGLTFSFRVLRPDGVVIVNTFPLTTGASRVVSVFNIDLTEGFLLGMSSQLLGTPIVQGIAWSQVVLYRGSPTDFKVHQVLTKGMLTGNNSLGWPASNMKDPIDGQGYPVVASSTPAAGAEVAIVVPANVRWRLRSLLLTLTTSAAAANREVALRVQTGPDSGAIPSGFTQIASTAHRYTFGLGLSTVQGATALIHATASPDVIYGPGTTIGTTTTNLQAGDQYTTVGYEVEEWAEPN